jgi:anthranilate phosphoribosyltransferase
MQSAEYSSFIILHSGGPYAKTLYRQSHQHDRPDRRRSRAGHDHHHDRPGHPGPDWRVSRRPAHERRNGRRNHRLRPRHAFRFVKVPVSDRSKPVYDVVGTGGDGAHTFNISTAAAFVVAGAGRRVAKHGNRAASSQCGSADVLAALGLNLDLTPEQVGQAIDEIGIGFMFAPKFHPAMKHAVGPRKEIGQRTIFNVLGPLTNPAGADIQLTGVYAPTLTEPLAHVLNELGSRAALVIHGAGGTDELSLLGPNRVSHLQDGAVRTYDLDPADYGFARATIADLRGGDPDQSAQMMRDLFTGKLNGARCDAVLLNTAGTLSAETGDFKTALAEAETSLNSGAALAKMNQLVEFSQSI